jgi:anthranilate synthase component I
MNEIAILPSRERFRALARAGNVISVSAELMADSETPVSAFQKVDDGYCFL